MSGGENWVEVDYYASTDKRFHHGVYRLRVPGGWLYRFEDWMKGAPRQYDHVFVPGGEGYNPAKDVQDVLDDLADGEYDTGDVAETRAAALNDIRLILERKGRDK